MGIVLMEVSLLGVPITILVREPGLSAVLV